MIVVDTGPIVALLNDRDDHHARCREFLVEVYADLPLGAVDASVIALTERLALPAVATLDHRHFSVVRPRHLPALTLLPN